jgi:hypothetical protein
MKVGVGGEGEGGDDASKGTGDGDTSKGTGGGGADAVFTVLATS